MNQYKVGLFFKEKRIACGLTQSEVAKALGYGSSQFVSNWERGLCNPPYEHIGSLSKLLKVPKSEVIDLVLSELRRELEVNFQGSGKPARKKRR